MKKKKIINDCTCVKGDMHTGLCARCQQKLEESGVAYDDRNDDSGKHEGELNLGR